MNERSADRLDRFRLGRRFYSPEEANALLDEAATRLRHLADDGRRTTENGGK